jgi:hypothetical protein
MKNDEDEDHWWRSGLIRIESLVIINLRGVSTNKKCSIYMFYRHANLQRTYYDLFAKPFNIMIALFLITLCDHNVKWFCEQIIISSLNGDHTIRSASSQCHEREGYVKCLYNLFTRGKMSRDQVYETPLVSLYRCSGFLLQYALMNKGYSLL